MKKIIRKLSAIILLSVILISSIVGATFAYLSATAHPAENSFNVDQEVNPEVEELFKDNVKSNVLVNVGNLGYSVYVRAAIVVTWENGSNVYSRKPVADKDYLIDINLTDWILGTDGFYYYKLPVVSGGATTELIESCTQKSESPASGYKLHVEIIAQTIQALGTTDADDNIAAVEDAWGVTLDSSGSIVSAP